MIDKDYLFSHFEYDPITGLFTRISDNIVIEAKDSKGYIILKIKGKQHLAHRSAFVFMKEIIPVEVDHINNIRDDNRWCNLRSATRQQQCFNSSVSITNTSGYKGVHWHKGKQKWVATIRVNGKKKHLGMFNDVELASEAYQNAALFYYGEFAKF